MYNRRPESILVALDPVRSVDKTAAIHQTLTIGAYAQSIGASLVLYHGVQAMVPFAEPESELNEVTTNSEIERMTQVLKRIQTQVQSAALPVRVVVEAIKTTPLAQKICAAVSEQKCDMLCINTHAAEKRFMVRVGSIANDILLNAEFPVAVLAPNTSAFANAPETFQSFLKNSPTAIVVPVEVSTEASQRLLNDAFVKHAIDIARPMGAEIHLYSAVQVPPMFRPKSGGFRPAGAKETAGTFRQDIEGEVRRLQQIIEDEGLRCDSTIEDSSAAPGKQISRFAGTKGTWNWIVVATRRKSHISRWAFGSVAHDVAHHSLNPTIFLPHRVLSDDIERES